jgi:hypothetical protein
VDIPAAADTRAVADTRAAGDIPAAEVTREVATAASGAATAGLVAEATAASATDLACLPWVFSLRRQSVT